MNLLKSMFVSLYMMSAMIITVYSIWAFLHSDQRLEQISWIGPLMTSAPFMLLLSWLMISTSIARTSAHFPLLNGLGLLGVLIAGASFLRGANVNALLISLIGWLGFIIYAYWYSSFGRKASERLTVGQMLPQFQVKDIAGKIIGSSSLFDKATIWMFYRGAWCPLCMAQIKELAAQYQELQAMGVRVALIAPQPHKNTIKLSKQFDVPFDFLTDEGNKAARILGIENPQGLPMGMQILGYDSETVLPTVIITNTEGQILWAHETDNYRIRPEPDVFLEVLRENGLAGSA